MKIFIIGQKSFGAAVAAMIPRDTDHALLGACAPAWKDPDAPSAFTFADVYRDPLRAFVEDQGLYWIPPEDLKPEGVPRCDLIVLAHAHVFVSDAIRGRARHGALGYHPSLLPLHRGRDAIRWSVHMRERITGGTVYWVDDGIDSGPIAAQRHVFIRPGDDPSSLWRRELFPLGLELLRLVIDQVAEGTSQRIPQEEAVATWEPSWRRPQLRRRTG